MFQQKTHMESAFRLISSHIRYLDPCASVGVGPVQYFGICFVAYPLHSTKWIFAMLSIHYIWHVIACTMCINSIIDEHLTPIKMLSTRHQWTVNCTNIIPMIFNTLLTAYRQHTYMAEYIDNILCKMINAQAYALFIHPFNQICSV